MKTTLFKTFFAAACLSAFLAADASACHTCKRTPCAMPAPQPAYRCVTEMVPYTVMKTRTKVDYVPETRTVMGYEPETTFVQKTCTVMRPVYDTKYITRHYTIARPVYDTSYVTQNYTVCRPVSTTRQVTEYCMQPTSWTETVPVMARASTGCCGMGLLCGKFHGSSCGGLTQVGCQTVTRTSYTPVPVVRNVVETTMINETHSRQVEVKTCRMVTEQKVETVPIKVCRMVPEVRTVQVPVTRMKCVPKTVTRMVPVCSKEVVPVTCYKPVRRMVPTYPEPVMTTLAAGPYVSGQSMTAASGQYSAAAQASIPGPPPIPAK